MRPLDRLTSIKAKLSVVIVAAVVVTAVVGVVGIQLGLPPLVCLVLAIVVALALVQVLARGLTAPLREMAAAATAMAGGEHGRTVTVPSRDEVGELARAFNAMAKQLGETDRMRRDLVANAAHELRTPISALQAVLENVADGVEAPDEATLRALLGQVERLARLTNQLLDLSKLESEAVPYAPVPFELAPVLAEAARESRLRAEAPAPVDVDAPDGLVAFGDPVRVHQVVVNLVDNALRHSPAGARVAVRARVRDAATCIEVSDEGPGIPDDEASRVFERFYRADVARADDGGGAGLGLAIVRWIVELHGGAVRAERREPRGCRMVVELPVAR